MRITFKYLVITCLLLLFAQVAYSEITLRELTVDASLEKDGSATVRETYVLNVIGNQSMDKYNMNIQYLQKNDLQTWLNNLQFSELKYHIGGREAPISDLIITPSPLYGINYYTEEALAKIILDYKVQVPVQVDNESRGLFIVTNPKPRITRYTLNTKGLNFETTETGDIILPEGTTLTFDLYRGMYIVYVQPLPGNINTTRVSDIKSDTLTWSSTGILPKYVLILEYEQPLDQEITDYIEGLNKNAYDLITGREGLPIIIIVVIAIVSLAYWHRMRNK